MDYNATMDNEDAFDIQEGTNSSANVFANKNAVLPETDGVRCTQNLIEKEKLKGSNCPVSDGPCISDDAGDIGAVTSGTVGEDRQPGSGPDGTQTPKSRAGHWAPIPGHPRTMKWVPVKTSQPLSNSPRHQRKGCCTACDRRCTRCWHRALFGGCCVPLTVCLFCCGPPGWLAIYIIITERQRQEREGRED